MYRICTCIEYVPIYIYIYRYIDRERERENMFRITWYSLSYDKVVLLYSRASRRCWGDAIWYYIGSESVVRCIVWYVLYHVVQLASRRVVLCRAFLLLLLLSLYDHYYYCCHCIIVTATTLLLWLSLLLLLSSSSLWPNHKNNDHN